MSGPRLGGGLVHLPGGCPHGPPPHLGASADGLASSTATLPPPGYSVPRTGSCAGFASPPRNIGGPRLGGATSPPRGGAQPQPGAAPPPRSSAGDPSAVKWREAYMELQEERRRAEGDLGAKQNEVSGLASDVQALREQLERERIETQASVDQYSKRIESLREENKRIEMKLMRTQLRESAKVSEATDVRREVAEKTAAIEKELRELQQQQQATLSRVKNIATSMLTACSGPPKDRTGSPSSSVAGGRVETGGSGEQLLGGGNILIGGMRSSGSAASLASRRQAAVAAAPTPERQPSVAGGNSPDADAHRWFQSVKGNLEHFGDVEVFVDSSTRDCACCCEPMRTDYRVRPRKCRHVFHIECLLQWWTEGTCPVCSVSFAPDPSQQGRRGASQSQASSEPSGRRSPSTGSAVGTRWMPGGNVAARGGVGVQTGTLSPSPLLSRPAGLPGPGTFGGADLSPGIGTFGGAVLPQGQSPSTL